MIMITIMITSYICTPFDLKAFKISERAASGCETITRRHRMHDLTTRIHPPGAHQLPIVINGVVKASHGFELTC